MPGPPNELALTTKFKCSRIYRFNDISENISLIPIERIERAIIVVRAEKVMLDSEPAEIYGVETKVLNQAVKRNASRFPTDFMFQLTTEEWESLRS